MGLTLLTTPPSSPRLSPRLFSFAPRFSPRSELGPDTYSSLENHMNMVFYLLERVKAEVLKDPMDK
jgi:hypothetical protein